MWIYRGVCSMILVISSAKDLFTTNWSKNVLCKKVCLWNWMSVSVSRTGGLDQSLCRTKIICYQTCIKPHGLCKTHSLHHIFLTPLGHFSCCNRHQQAGRSVFLQSDKLPKLMHRFLMQEIVASVAWGALQSTAMCWTKPYQNGLILKLWKPGRPTPSGPHPDQTCRPHGPRLCPHLGAAVQMNFW